jgi:branched-subunit amino acid transport protein AzlD
MSATGALVAVLVAAAGTYAMRLVGLSRTSHRLTGGRWLRWIPLAVLLVLAVTAVSTAATPVPSPPTAMATALVATLAARRAPLLLSVLAGCAAYVAATAWLPAAW